MTSKETPKKTYGVTKTTFDLSSCRLCRAIGDSRYCKNLFKPSNLVILNSVQLLHGAELDQDKSLPHLVCRACERKLKNFVAFKTIIDESQSYFLQADSTKSRIKRCIEVSPSVSKPPLKTRTSSAAARSLTFSGTASSEVNKDGAQTQPKTDLFYLSNAGLGRQHPYQNEKINLDVTSVKHLTAVIETGNIQHIVDAVCEHEILFSRIMQLLFSRIHSELVQICRNKDPAAINVLEKECSVLQQRDYDSLKDVTWEEIMKELSNRCPLTLDIISVLLEGTYRVKVKLPAACLIYSMVVFTRNNKLSLLQRINTTLLIEGNASTMLIDRLHKYGICLESSSKYTIMDEIGDHNLDVAVEMIRTGHTFVCVLDNIDWDIRVHDSRQHNQNQSVHAIASCLVFDRVTSSHLPDVSPKQDLAVLNHKELISPTMDELAQTKKRYRYIVARIITEYLPAFQFLKQFVPPNLPHPYQQQTSCKSTIVTLTILLKDEKNYSDCVDVLDTLEEWLEEIMSKAHGREVGNLERGPPIAAPAHPGQPASHLPPKPEREDPLVNVKIPCFGDQLTRVRIAGAKDLRAGAHNPKDRLDHLHPIRIVHWHTKNSFLKVCFRSLYANSSREQGTLCYYKDKLNRKKVSVKVKHYEDCEQLFLSVGKMHVVEAVLTFFGMNAKEDMPTKNIPPPVFLLQEAQKEAYFHDTIDEFLDTYVFTKAQKEVEGVNNVKGNVNEEEDPDKVNAYALNLLRCYMVLEDFKDAVREGDGERLATLAKILLPHFKVQPGFNAYTIEMLVNILQDEVLLSQRQTHQVQWAATSNMKGGSKRNIEIDLMKENINCDQKKLIKSMGANKSEQAITRASRAAIGIRQIINNFDDLCFVRQPSTAHSHKSSDADEQAILGDLRDLRPFSTVPGRNHKSFTTINEDPLHSLDTEEFDKWLTRHKRNILMGYQAVIDDAEFDEFESDNDEEV